jgi:outer membrane assembly lipoprotein YfiO
MTIKSILACVILSIFVPFINCEKSASDTKAKKLSKKAEKLAKPSYPFPKILLKDQTEEQLEQSLSYGKAVEDKDLVLKTFFYLVSQSKSQEKIKLFKMDYANYNFDIADYEKSLMAYEEFCMLYPGSPEAEYAQYKAILCNFFLSLSFDHDQTLTQRTISSCLLFLQKVKDEKFLKETENIYKSCRQRLFDHEVYVLETYLKLKKFSSARKRIEYIEKEFKDIAHLTEYVAYCNEIYKIVENPKTRPFIIQLNLKNALTDKKDQTLPTKVARASSFFLA